LRTLDHDADSEARAGIVRVVHVISAVDVIDVDVIGVIPARRPGLNESKPKTAILKARIPADQDRVAHAEVVPAAKIGAEPVVRNPAAASGAQAKSRLRALRLHGLLCALGRVRTARLLLVSLLLLPVGMLLLFWRAVLLLFWGLSLLLLLMLWLLLRSLGLLLMLRLLFRSLSLLLMLWLLFRSLSLLLMLRLLFRSLSLLLLGLSLFTLLRGLAFLFLLFFLAGTS